MSGVHASAAERRFVLAALLPIAGCGVGLVLYATPPEGALTLDSVVYVDAARNLLGGKGYVSRALECIALTWTDSALPVTRFPPLLSGAIAALAGLLAIDPATAGRWLNAFLLGANSLLVGLAVLRFTRGSRSVSALGALLAMGSPVTLDIHTLVVTEPLFILLGIGGLLLVISYIATGSRCDLAAAAGSIGLACLDRYIGISLAATGAIGILLSCREGTSRRVRDALLFLFMSALPLACFLGRNLAAAGDVAHRSVSLSLPSADFWRSALFTLGSWFFPGSDRFTLFPYQDMLVQSVSLLAAGAVAAMGISLATRGWGEGGLSSVRRRLGNTPLLLLAFVVVFVGSLVLSRCTVDPLVHLNSRHTAIVYVASIILGCRVLSVFSGDPAARRRTRFLVLGTAFCYAVACLGAGSVWASYARQHGRGITGRLWKNLAIGEQVRRLPGDRLIFTTGAESSFAIYHFAGRVTYPVSAFDTGGPAWAAEAKRRMAAQPAVLLHYSPPARPPRSREHLVLEIPSIAEARMRLSAHGFSVRPLTIEPGREVHEIIPEPRKRGD